MKAAALYDSIIPCFGSRFTVVMMPHVRRYRVHPLGTFHYFDWQRPDTVGVSVGTCPQIVSSETARIGITVGDATRILPFDEGETFAKLTQRITPLTTVLEVSDPLLPFEATFTFRSAFYPQSFEYSCAPGYMLEVRVTNAGQEVIEADVFFGLTLPMSEVIEHGFRAAQRIVFPDGIDHQGIDGLIVEQIIAGDNTQIPRQSLTAGTNGESAVDLSILTIPVRLQPGETRTVHFYHAAYIAQPTLNRRGDRLKFGYTSVWDSADDVLSWWRENTDQIIRKGSFFESTILDATVPPELKDILSAAFKGLASNTWWAEDGWFSVMEIGAYHSTLDVDYQSALFFFQYWPELVRRMLNQWAAFYRPGSGYVPHDLGQHLEATGNRYGGPGSAMKVEENCNFLILLHHFWRATGDGRVLVDKHGLIRELVDFLVASDTSGSGLPNQYADNTNDWGSGLITASEEQSYHGVRMAAAFSAVADIAYYLTDGDLAERCTKQAGLINQTLENGWLGDHYPISLADPESFHHYSMWTAHGLLYALRSGISLDVDLDKLRIDLISSTRRTMREHGCVHSTVDVRGWLTQNLWRDCIAAYLGVDMTGNLRRYLGHGEYVSYEDATILEVANELMVVPGAVADHTYAGETHDFPMVDGHPRPACGFGLLYALAGVQYDGIAMRLSFSPVVFPLKIALTHLADWENERVAWVTFRRSVPNQDGGAQPASVVYSMENEDLLEGWETRLRPISKR